MGKVVEKVKLTNLFEPKKSVEVDAVIDTGATMLVLPQDVIEELGLRKIGERRVRYANNQIQIKSVYRGVILELKGRDGIFDVLGEVEGSEPLVGQIVLEALDLIVDPITKTVIPNPRSPDMPMTEILMTTAYNSGYAVRSRPPKFRGSPMNNMQEKIVEILIKRGKELLNQPYRKIEFTGNPEADDLLNDIKNFPHAFVLACIMDRQIKAERAWLIPYEISKEIGGFEFSRLLKIDQNEFREIFRRKNLHRFNDTMAEYFYLGIQKIHRDYNDDASNIWKGKPRSATVIKRFLEFKGVGVKIATMAANILARDFKIPMADYICIDVSPDTHVKRVFKRLGFISKNASNDELIYSARELNPEYPGIFDLSCWEIGRNWCKPRKPDCKNCYLDPYCPKKI